jgi:magnesium transporter
MRFHFDNHGFTNDDGSSSKLPPSVDTRPVIFHIIQYDELHYVENTLNSLSELNSFLSTTSCSNEDHCTWMNVEGIHQTDILDELSILFNFHALIKEDICTINERMKVDVLDNASCIYLLMKMIYIHPNTKHVQHEQISFILKENNFLITFQEAKDKTNSYDVFQVVTHRLKNNRGRIRSLKIDYLFYCLIDVLVENYMFVLDLISIQIDMIDKLLMNKLKNTNHLNVSKQEFNIETLRLIFLIKHDMLSFKILCQPLREIIIKLQKTQDRISVSSQAAHYTSFKYYLYKFK